MNFKSLFCWAFFLAIKGGQSHLCYSCRDLTTNDDCFNTTICPDDEDCFGRADGYVTGEVKHTTGCTKDLIIPTNSGPDGFTFCANRCRGNLCNLDKCEKGNRTRGFRCLSCDFVNSPSDCHTVVECSHNGVCMSERITLLERSKYRFSCINREQCDMSSHNSPTIIGKRSSSGHCAVCCESNHCNMLACGENYNGQVFRLKPMQVDCSDTDPVLCSTVLRLNTGACDEPYIIKTCPKTCIVCDHFGWSAWGPWGSCSTTCDHGTKVRHRQCQYRLNTTTDLSCRGPSTDIGTCFSHCPVNGGWCADYSMCVPNVNAGIDRKSVV